MSNEWGRHQYFYLLFAHFQFVLMLIQANKQEGTQSYATYTKKKTTIQNPAVINIEKIDLCYSIRFFFSNLSLSKQRPPFHIPHSHSIRSRKLLKNLVDMLSTCIEWWHLSYISLVTKSADLANEQNPPLWLTNNFNPDQKKMKNIVSKG